MKKQERMAPLTVTLPSQTLAWGFRDLFNFDKQIMGKLKGENVLNYHIVISKKKFFKIRIHAHLFVVCNRNIFIYFFTKKSTV